MVSLLSQKIHIVYKILLTLSVKASKLLISLNLYN